MSGGGTPRRNRGRGPRTEDLRPLRPPSLLPRGRGGRRRGHAGGSLALVPEGKSHSDPALQPLKTGAARIVLEAERKLPGLGVRIVPVGLLFDRKGKFRSRALVQVGG